MSNIKTKYNEFEVVNKNNIPNLNLFFIFLYFFSFRKPNIILKSI